MLQAIPAYLQCSSVQKGGHYVASKSVTVRVEHINRDGDVEIMCT